MSDETAESYKWILEYTIKAIMIELLVFIINVDLTADVAIKQIYLTTYPIHYIFHISETYQKISNPNFVINMISLFIIFLFVVTV